MAFMNILAHPNILRRKRRGLKDVKALNYVQDKLGSWLEEGDDIRFYPLCLNCRQKAFDARHQRIAKLPSLVVV